MTTSAIDKSRISTPNVDLLNKVENIIDYAIITTKEISNNLTPHVLERYGIQTAIEIFIKNLNLNKGIEIIIDANIKKERFVHSIEVILYRICCELINNTVKYASASKVSIFIKKIENEIVLEYEDNGVGFNIKEKENVGMGLTNMCSRVRSLEGSIDLQSTINNGFYAKIKLPV